MIHGFLKIENGCYVQQTPPVLHPVMLHHKTQDVSLYVKNVKKFCFDNGLDETSLSRQIREMDGETGQWRNFVVSRKIPDFDLFDGIAFRSTNQFRPTKLPYIIDNYKDRTVDVVFDVTEYAIKHGLKQPFLTSAYHRGGCITPELGVSRFAPEFEELFRKRKQLGMNFFYESLIGVPTLCFDVDADYKDEYNNIEIFDQNKMELYVTKSVEKFRVWYNRTTEGKVSQSQMSSVKTGRLEHAKGLVLFKPPYKHTFLPNVKIGSNGIPVFFNSKPIFEEENQ